MANESVLERPADVFSPFDAAEAKRMREYVTDVQELVDGDLFKSGDWSFRIQGGVFDETVQEWEYPGERAVREASVLFRQLYKDHEQSSYNHIINLLSEHVHDGPTGRPPSPSCARCGSGKARF